jgi:hypothetical protein
MTTVLPVLPPLERGTQDHDKFDCGRSVWPLATPAQCRPPSSETLKHPFNPLILKTFSEIMVWRNPPSKRLRAPTGMAKAPQITVRQAHQAPKKCQLGRCHPITTPSGKDLFSFFSKT